MNDENVARLVASSKGFLPHNLYIQCNDGWFNLLNRTMSLIGNRIGRWNEVVDIRSNLIKRGEDPLNYTWIQEYFAKYPENPWLNTKASCIKEKFGGLRIYYDGPVDDYIDGVIDMAEGESFITCEQCGGRGEKRYKGGYIYVSCEEHKL